MIADISSGNTGFSDVMLLVALIIFLVAAVVAYMAKAFWATALSVGLAAIALGWLVL